MSYDHAGPPGFGLESREGPGGALVCHVRGELDIFTAPRLREMLDDATDAGRRLIVIDLTEATFVDSTALGVIIAAMKGLAPSGGRLALVNTRPSIAKTLAITGLDRALAVGGSVEGALAALER